MKRDTLDVRELIYSVQLFSLLANDGDIIEDVDDALDKALGRVTVGVGAV